MRKLLMVLGLGMALSGCGLIYKIDVAQGNYLEQEQIDKLRAGMTKEQVQFVLGTPLLRDSFDANTWYYKYAFRSGKGKLTEKELKARFDDSGKLLSLEGEDFELPTGFTGN
ncbi:outer membrane protein assembly factor BamE [Gallaecimonas sp. GXIMD4217]|uniref:outer membrane protein assembly factor BamE n=1 Tax=Gallaecimonas sp. GXIMD4217 TaxID=3131927 RepID=UPI00311AE644